MIAHPYWDVKVPEQVEELIRALDIGGIEVFYPSHTRKQTEHLLNLANELGVTATASSDFHGPTHKTFSRFGAYETYELGEPAGPGAALSGPPELEQRPGRGGSGAEGEPEADRGQDRAPGDVGHAACRPPRPARTTPGRRRSRASPRSAAA